LLAPKSWRELGIGNMELEGKEIRSRALRHMKASGFTGFLSLSAGLCAIFAGCVTVSDWYSEIAQAHRPVVSKAPDHLHTDVVLFAIAVVACVILMESSKRLRAREDIRGTAVGDGNQNRVVGILFVAMGLLLASLMSYRAIHMDAVTLDSLMGVPASLMFVFAGILLGLPPEYIKWRAFLATLVVTCFALTFDWVAFVPGERKFSGSFLGFGFIPSAFFGRVTFGICAIILDICAAAMWFSFLAGRMQSRPARNA
jgi:hypothetical protein